MGSFVIRQKNTKTTELNWCREVCGGACKGPITPQRKSAQTRHTLTRRRTHQKNTHTKPADKHPHIPKTTKHTFRAGRREGSATHSSGRPKAIPMARPSIRWLHSIMKMNLNSDRVMSWFSLRWAQPGEAERRGSEDRSERDGLASMQAWVVGCSGTLGSQAPTIHTHTQHTHTLQ